MGRVIGDGLFEGGEEACGEAKFSRPLLVVLLMRGSLRGVAGNADRSRGVSSMPYVWVGREDTGRRMSIHSNFSMFAFRRVVNQAESWHW